MKNIQNNTFNEQEEIYEDEFYVDKEDLVHNFTTIPNSLIRNSELSPNCRWLIIYLLSNSPKWVIKTSQLESHLKGFIGRDKIQKLIKEAINAGYIQRKEILVKQKRGFLKRCRYKVSSTPKFKNVLRKPDFQCPDFQEPENTSDKERTSKERKYIRTNNTSLEVSKKPPADASPQCDELPEKPKKKPKRLDEFSDMTRKVTRFMLDVLMKNNRAYRPPGDLIPMHLEVQSMLEDDNQDPDLLMKTFEYGASDDEKRGDWRGWKGILAKNKKRGKQTNPAAIFRDHYPNILAQMDAKQARKFCPSSDQDRARKAMEEMNSRAL